MVTVKGLDIFGEEEAAVDLSDGEYSCVAFSHPNILGVGDVLSKPLLAFEHGLVTSAEAKSPEIRHQSSLGTFSHWLVATVKSLSPGTVAVGGIDIEGILIPGDIAIGDRVQCSVERLDIQ